MKSNKNLCEQYWKLVFTWGHQSQTIVDIWQCTSVKSTTKTKIYNHAFLSTPQLQSSVVMKYYCIVLFRVFGDSESD